MKLYDNKKGIVINKKYYLGKSGNTNFYKINNKDIFFINILGVHFYYLRIKTKIISTKF